MWKPEVRESRAPLYLAIAQALADDIALGHLRPGDRLPTQRELGSALGVALGTVTRAYAEAERLGLIRGEIGRGTFVAQPAGRPVMPGRAGAEELPRPPEESSGVIDLSVNLPVYSEDPDLGSALRRLGERPDLDQLLHYQAHAGMELHRRAGARWVERFGLDVGADSVLICAGTQNALTVAFSALAEPGDVVLTEQLTYPGVKAVARHLNLRLEGVEMDEGGLVPGAVVAAVEKLRARGRRARVLYLMPTLHNPTSASLSEARRREIADIARRHDLAIMEDDADRLLVAGAPPPLSSLAPERSYFVAGMSKAVSGGLRIAFLVAPPGQVERLAHGLWATHWMVAPLMAEIATLWIDDGTADLVVERKRTESAARQRMAREILSGIAYRAHPNGYHLWIELPNGWKSAELVAEAHRRGVAVTPAESFAVGEAEVPPAVRACLGAARDRRDVRTALTVLAGILRSDSGLGSAIV